MADREGNSIHAAAVPLRWLVSAKFAGDCERLVRAAERMLAKMGENIRKGVAESRDFQLIHEQYTGLLADLKCLAPRPGERVAWFQTATAKFGPILGPARVLDRCMQDIKAANSKYLPPSHVAVLVALASAPMTARDLEQIIPNRSTLYKLRDAKLVDQTKGLSKMSLDVWTLTDLGRKVVAGDIGLGFGSFASAMASLPTEGEQHQFVQTLARVADFPHILQESGCQQVHVAVAAYAGVGVLGPLLLSQHYTRLTTSDATTIVGLLDQTVTPSNWLRRGDPRDPASFWSEILRTTGKAELADSMRYRDLSVLIGASNAYLGNGIPALAELVEKRHIGREVVLTLTPQGRRVAEHVASGEIFSQPAVSDIQIAEIAHKLAGLPEEQVLSCAHTAAKLADHIAAQQLTAL